MSEAAPPEPAGPQPEPPKRESVALILFKKKKIRVHGGGGAHGGSWKIAYADFVTAMMAFFLLMWLLMSTNHGDLEGIAQYFNRPLQAAFQQGPGAAATTAPLAPGPVKVEQGQKDHDTLQILKAKLDALIHSNPKLQSFQNQIKVDVTAEGLRIQIVDDKDRPMFDSGRAVLKDYSKDILEQIGLALNGVQNRVSITGHTDSLQYSAGEAGYSNWDLSADRANAARRELIAGGMSEKKLVQVRGLADALPLVKSDPSAPANRRISIVVMNSESVTRLLRDDQRSTVQVGPSAPLTLPSP